jgi:lipopolysaccharide export system protein LptC
MNSRSTLISLLLIAIMGLAAYISFFPNRPPLPTNIGSVAIPDAYMEEVNALIMDKDGKLKMKIQTPRLVHFNNDDITNLTAPLITLYRQSPMPWYISSNYAKSTQGIDNVHFRENVVIRHAMDKSTPETVIKTTSLMVHPNAKTAETNELITLLQPNLTMTSIGMIANMDSGDIKLLSQPRGEYVPNS